MVLLLISACMAASSQQPANSLSGKIVDEKSNAVSDASVYILNSQSGTTTNKQGEFELYGIPCREIHSPRVCRWFCGCKQAH